VKSRNRIYPGIEEIYRFALKFSIRESGTAAETAIRAGADENARDTEIYDEKSRKIPRYIKNKKYLGI
jgi:hypothetical protein